MLPAARRPLVLVLGGTAEARALASHLTSRPAAPLVLTSLAGRTRAPAAVAGEVRTGGFGGVEGLASWLTDNRPQAVVDATHPFATAVSANAATACAATGIPLLRLQRPAWREREGDRWHRVPDLGAAARAVPALGERVFLTTGRQDVGPFVALDDLWFLLRSVDAPAGPLPRRCEVLSARGPFDADGEERLMRRHGIDVVVTKDSGGAATEGKLEAARRLGIAVVVVDRPPVAGPPVEAVADVGEAVAWVAARLDGG